MSCFIRYVHYLYLQNIVIINKTKFPLSQAYVTLVDFGKCVLGIRLIAFLIF